MSIAFPILDRPAPQRVITTDRSEDILRFALEGAESGNGVALVTLVEITGGAARALGAQMAVWDCGAYCGFVSGGCTEAAVAAEAVLAITKGTDRLFRLGQGSPFFDIVLPCGGGITLAIHILRDCKPIHAVLDALDQRRSSGLCYDPARKCLRQTTDFNQTGWQGEAFARIYRPRMRLHLCGRSIELEATERLARAADFETIVHDHEKELHPDLGRIDADSAVALLYHDIEHEMPILEQALKAQPFYIGALGSCRTHERRCEALRARGYSQTQTARIRGPIGLIDRARDAQTLALSVISEIAAVRSQLPR